MSTKPSLLLSTLLVASLTLLWCWLRLSVFWDSVLPLTYVLPLMICVWTRRPWQLWSMAVVFVIASVFKLHWILPSDVLPGSGDITYTIATLFNISMGAFLILAIIRLRNRLEKKNALITIQNAELEAQAEELAQQNEEIRAQNEELAGQNEEIESQSEEAARQNEELQEANHRLTQREEILQGLVESSSSPEQAAHSLDQLCRRTLTVIGAPASAVGILLRDGDSFTLMASASTDSEALILPPVWPAKESLAGLVFSEEKTAYVSELSERPDLAMPFSSMEGKTFESALATPIRISGSSGGVLVICSLSAFHWTEDQFRSVEWVAAQSGLMLEAVRWQTILKERAYEVEQASRAKDNFLAALSHELRTPLTPILMTAAALRDDNRLPEDARSQLGVIERNIALEARLIDDLLDLTRIAKGKLPLRPQHCDAHSLISLAIEIVKDDAHEKGIILERDFHAEKSGLIADPSRIQQVVWNLLRNAVKFTPKGGKICIRTRDESSNGDASHLQIEVSDTGIGIPTSELDHIFQPFEQGETSGDHRFGGLGLGLSIAKAIVDLHHGSITAQSEGPNQGATFTVDLPGAREAPSGMIPSLDYPEAEAEEGISISKTPPLRILLVEDHDATLRVLSRLLEKTGHDVMAVNSVSASLEAAATQPFDLVISDLGLPDGSGNEMMERLRDTYNLRGIALSGYGMEQDLDISRQSGFLVHLTKPIDFNQLKRAISTVCQADIDDF